MQKVVLFKWDDLLELFHFGIIHDILMVETIGIQNMEGAIKMSLTTKTIRNVFSLKKSGNEKRHQGMPFKVAGKVIYFD